MTTPTDRAAPRKGKKYHDWVAFATRKPRAEEYPVIAGSYRKDSWRGSGPFWSISGAFNYQDGYCWDDDRTHWHSLPKPPAAQPRRRGRGGK